MKKIFVSFASVLFLMQAEASWLSWLGWLYTPQVIDEYGRTLEGHKGHINKNDDNARMEVKFNYAKDKMRWYINTLYPVE